MELGEKLRQARIQAGLSQRELCGEEITRNMLSQIEHGVCNPSVSTLCYLARRLELPVSYFLGEEAAVSSNAGCMASAWAALEAGDAAQALNCLEQYRTADRVCDREYAILKALVLLHLAEHSLEAGKRVYAGKLLEKAGELELPWLPELERRRRLLLARLGDIPPLGELPSLDEELMLYAQAALGEGETNRGAALLDACGSREDCRWQLLRGRAHYEAGEYEAAVELLLQAEKDDPEAAIPLLEQCFSSLGDYRSAYSYACKRRK